MEQLFAPGHIAVNQLEDFQELFNSTDAYFYNRKNPRSSFGFNVAGETVKNIYLNKDSLHPSPLKFFDKLGAQVNEAEVNKYLNRNNELSSVGFFNEHLKIANEYLKPFLP